MTRKSYLSYPRASSPSLLVFDLDESSLLLFITDGVTEREDEQRELFGSQRLTDHLKHAAGPPYGRNLLKALDAWRGTAEASDDLTMLEIWRDPV